MAYYALKVLISAILVVVIAEVGKRSSFAGGFLASLPLISILAFIWLYLDTRSVAKVTALSTSIFWLVLPSLSLFAALPWLLKRTEDFYVALGGSILIMLGCYGVMVLILQRFRVEF